MGKWTPAAACEEAAAAATKVDQVTQTIHSGGEVLNMSCQFFGSGLEYNKDGRGRFGNYTLHLRYFFKFEGIFNNRTTILNCGI
jgi:hypothetical protein